MTIDITKLHQDLATSATPTVNNTAEITTLQDGIRQIDEIFQMLPAARDTEDRDLAKQRADMVAKLSQLGVNTAVPQAPAGVARSVRTSPQYAAPAADKEPSKVRSWITSRSGTDWLVIGIFALVTLIVIGLFNGVSDFVYWADGMKGFRNALLPFIYFVGYGLIVWLVGRKIAKYRNTNTQ